jgi:hypothetical protein
MYGLHDSQSFEFCYQINAKATQTEHQKQTHITITTYHEIQYYSEGNDLLDHSMEKTQTQHYELENISRTVCTEKQNCAKKKYHEKKTASILYFCICSY